MEQTRDNILAPGATFSSNSCSGSENSSLAAVLPLRRQPANSNEQIGSAMQAQSSPGPLAFQPNGAGVNNPATYLQAISNIANLQTAPAQTPFLNTEMPPNHRTIWEGVLEWKDISKQTYQIPCTFTSKFNNGEIEVKSETWPMKLIMQFIPKIIIGDIGQAYLKNSKSVVFFPSPCEASESLIKVMSDGFAGCVHFTATATCNIKVLLLLYTAEKRTFLGFIPNDQQAFVDRLRKVIREQKSSRASMVRQGPVPVRGNGAPGPSNQPMINSDRTVIWKGMLEWVEKTKTASDPQTWQVPCSVAATIKDGEAEVKAESWPMKLIMQLMPKVLIGNIGLEYLKNSKSVVFFPSPSEALESLIKVMSNGFAGCVHFTATATCNIKVLLLLYTAEKRTFLGFIPNDQQAFVDRLRKVIQQQKSSHASMVRQGPVPLRPTTSGTYPNVGASSIVDSLNTGLSQESTISIRENQPSQNVIPKNGILPQSMGSTSVPQNQFNGQAAAMPPINEPHINAGARRLDQRTEMERQQNLLKIQQLQKTLEAALQKEAQFKAMELHEKLKLAQIWFKEMELRLSVETRPQGKLERTKRIKFDNEHISQTASTSTAGVEELTQPSCSYSPPTSSSAASSSSGSNTSQTENRQIILPSVSSHNSTEQEPSTI